MAHIDTDIFIRFLTNDDPQKQAKATSLFEEVSQGLQTVACPDTVIADTVYVLSSKRLYNLPRLHIYELLTPLVRLSHLKVKNKRIVLRALELYGTINLDFGDGMIIASMEQAKEKLLYSFDMDFDKIPAITRLEP